MKKNNKKPKIRKYLPKYPNGDVFGAQDFNQPINNGDQNSGVYSDGTTGETYGTQNNGPSTGQYMQAGTSAIAGGTNMANTYQNKDATVAQGWNAGANTGATVVGAFNPLLGMAIGATNKIGNNLRTNQIEKTNADGTLKNKKFAEATAFTQTVANPLTWGSMINKGIYTPDQYGDHVEKENKERIANQFPMGGINGVPNAEVESSENSISPSGEFTQYNGPSHEQGGIPVNMEPGERIYSDRLKVPGTKLTFAELNKKNNTTKQDKVIEDDKADNVAKSTAKLIVDIKRQKSDRLFQEQEALKASKVQAYAKKMGLDIGNNFAMGGTKLPQYGGEPPYETNGTFIPQGWNDGTSSAIQMKGPINPNYVTPQQNNFNPMLNDAEQAERATMDDFTLTGQANSPDFRGQSLTPTKPQGQKFNYGQVIEPLVNTGLQNVGNIWDLNQTKMGKKYDREDSGQLTPERLNPKEAITQAQVEARINRNRLKDVTGGNVGSYLSNLTASQANNTMNKAKIYQDFENANVGIGNDFMRHNQQTRMLDKANEQQNKARSEDITRQAIADIGSKTSHAYKSYKAGKMDRNTAEQWGQVFKNYGLDASNPEHWEIISRKFNTKTA